MNSSAPPQIPERGPLPRKLFASRALSFATSIARYVCAKKQACNPAPPLVEWTQCPACLSHVSNQSNWRDWKGHPAFQVLACGNCGSSFTFPMPLQRELDLFYKTNFDYRWYSDFYHFKIQDAIARLNELEFQEGERILDFGGGKGYFSSVARDLGHESLTFDPMISPEQSIPATGNWHGVVALHVLEHSNDPETLIRKMMEFLSPEGRLVLAVPNAGGVGYRAHGMSWVWAQPPITHLIHFTAQGLQALLNRCGLDVVTMRYADRWDANCVSDIQDREFQKFLDYLWHSRLVNSVSILRKIITKVIGSRRIKQLKLSRDLGVVPEDLAEIVVIAQPATPSKTADTRLPS